MKDKEKVMRDYNGDILMRDTELESMRIRYEEELGKREKERVNMKQMYEDKLRR